MKILFVDHLGDLGGAEINMLNIIRHLDRTRFTPIVTCPSYGPLYERIVADDIAFESLSEIQGWGTTNMIRRSSSLASLLQILPLTGRYLQVVLNLRKIIARVKPDLLYLNTLKAGLIGGIAGKLCGVPIVQQMQDLVDPEEMNPLFRTLLRSSLKFLNPPLIAISDAVGQSLVALGVGPDKVTRIHNGIDIGQFQKMEEAEKALLKRSFRLQPDRVTVGITARLMQWKGQEVFIRAIPHVKSEAQFVIIGGLFWEEPDYEEKLRKLANELGVADKVHFLGHQKDMSRAINLLDLMVHASIRPEPFGLTIIEAMSTSLPVIATNRGGVPEIVQHQQTGLLVEPDDPEQLGRALNELLDDKQRLTQMGIAGRRRVEDCFDLTCTVKDIEELLLELSI